MRSTLAVLATGLGKTVVMAALCQSWTHGRVLALVHREELAFQFRDKVESYTGQHVDIEMAGWRADQCSLMDRTKIVVASVPTMNTRNRGWRRMERFKPSDFGLILTDEAHHATATTYRRIYDWFDYNPDICHVGFTATADRGDKTPLGSVFQTVATNRQIDWGIGHGWLVPLKQKIVHLNSLDLSTIRTRMGDLADGELEEVMLQEGNLHGVVSHTLNVMGTRPTLAYCTGVKQAHRIAELFCRYTESKIAVAIDGKTEKEDRRKALADFRTGRVQILCNCGVLTEGYDNPNVRLIVNARPTKKRGLYTQIVGRGTRPLPGLVDGDGWELRSYQQQDVESIYRELGRRTSNHLTFDTASADRQAAIANSAKPNCLVLDFTGVSGRHKLFTTLDLLGGDAYTDAERQRARHNAKSGDRAVDPEQALADARTELAEETRKRARMNNWRDVVLPETEVHADMGRVPTAKPTRADPASPKQLALLRRFRIPEDKLKGITRGGAGRLINDFLKRKRNK